VEMIRALNSNHECRCFSCHEEDKPPVELSIRDYWNIAFMSDDEIEEFRNRPERFHLDGEHELGIFAAILGEPGTAWLYTENLLGQRHLCTECVEDALKKGLLNVHEDGKTSRKYVSGPDGENVCLTPDFLVCTVKLTGRVTLEKIKETADA
jgi:hypothetical protein